MLTTDSILVTTLADSYGAPLVEYYLLPKNGVLYMRWHGHLTAAAVIRGIEGSMELMSQHPFGRVLSDKRDTTGDWGEALAWLQYDWLPQAVGAGLRAIAYVISPNLENRIVSQEFVKAVQPQINISVFTTDADARQWLRGQ